MTSIAAHPDKLQMKPREHDACALPLALPDLWSLICSQARRPTKITQVSGLHAKASLRGAYRIEFQDGCILKVRYLASPYLAQRILRVNQSVPTGLLSPILACSGSAVLEAWVEGTMLDTVELTPELSRAAGRLLGQIHSTTPPDGCSDYGQTLGTKAQQIEDALEELLGRGDLTQDEAVRLLEMAQSFLPTAADYGIVHGDLTAENIVVNEDRLVAIDNGGLSFDALDGDLARTWYRWPMSEELATCFYEGYQQSRDATAFRNNFAFWAIWVLCRAALFHLREQTGLESSPLRRLRECVGR